MRGVDEFDGVVLIGSGIDIHHTNTSRIIDGRVLEPLDGPVLSVAEHQELHIHLDMVPGDLFLIALDMGARRPSPGVSRQAVKAISPQHVIRAATRDFNLVIPIQVHGDAIGTEVVFPS